MNEEIEKVISFLAKRILDGVSADDAMKYAQAALNIANAGKVHKWPDAVRVVGLTPPEDDE